jgi:serine/threonine-protein kinase HipA
VSGLEVSLYDTPLGNIRTHQHSGVAFTPSAEGVERFGVGSPVLSLSMPLRLRPHTHASGPFFAGLLPEGEALERLAVLARTDPTDIVGLLAFAGRDVAGAVVLGSPAESQPSYVELDDVGVAERLRNAGRYPLGEVGGGTSLPGYQRKIALARVGVTFYAREGGAASTHILKPARSHAYDESIATEAYVLDLAHRLGLATYGSELRRFDDILTLVIERYDRRMSPGNPLRAERIHQEDGAQALGLGNGLFDRFEWHEPRAALSAVAALLDTERIAGYGSPADRERLLEYVAFNVAVGNTDAHAKNFSFLHASDGSVQLAPLYDVAAHALGFEADQRMAMAINGCTRQPDVTLADLVAESERWGVPPPQGRETVEGLLQGLLDAVDDAPLPLAHPDHLPNYIRHQARNLLEGRPARVTTPLPPILMPRLDTPIPPRGR